MIDRKSGDGKEYNCKQFHHSFSILPLLPVVSLNKDKENASLMEMLGDQSPIKHAALLYKSDLQSLPLPAQ